jgi:2-octaprenyl-6-methoxyphenol hydroxylase
MSEPLWRIAGTGPVGLACALFLVRRGVPSSAIALDPLPVPSDSIPAGLAARVLAVSYGSCQLLGRIATLPAAGRIGRVEVSISGHLGRTRIVADELGVPALGQVMRYGALLDSLRQAAAQHHWASLPTEPGNAGRIGLTIHAEGDAGEDARVREFDQSALLGEVAAPQARSEHLTTAFERFGDNGPLALLPLPQTRRWAMVWCDQADACEARRTLEPARLSAELQRRAGDMLGPLEICGPLALAPLTRRARRQIATPDAVWIGNAAQSLHPVAGQGLNLGLRDAFELADCLAQGMSQGVGDPASRHHRAAGRVSDALQAFERRRRADRSLTIGLTDLMAESFTWPLIRPVQSGVLGALDMLSALRAPLARQLMFGRR